MGTRRLLIRSVTYYWRTNLAVVIGVATAVAVLAGALLVGDSVRGSLRDLVLQRLGRTDLVIASAGFFREQLAGEIEAQPEFAATFSGLSPLVMAQGVVTAQENGRRAGQVVVYGVDDRFWRFHGVSGVSGPSDREALVSPALAAQLGLDEKDAILVRVQRPTDVPLESLHGRKDDLGRTVRLTVRSVVPAGMLGEFSLAPQQADVKAVFVPLALLQQELDVEGRVNTLLVSTRNGREDGAAQGLERLVNARASLDDVGLTVRALEERRALVVGSAAGVLDDKSAEAAQQVLSGSGMSGQPLFTYLASTIRRGGEEDEEESAGNHEIPYSLVTAIDLHAVSPSVSTSPDGRGRPPIVLNTWAASDLMAHTGDVITMSYYVWEEPGLLMTRNTEFHLAGVVPIEAADRDFAPAFAGITESDSLADWDPPFPIDLRRIRPADEDYWKRYRTTPKAFVPLEVGQRLWRSRHGGLSSVRVTPAAGQPIEDARRDYARRLRAAIDPVATGMAIRAARAEGLTASRGATDFGAYFTYFSFFLVISALLLAALFFRLGVEQRVREIGLLRAVGFSPGAVGRLFLGEGMLLALVGSVLGVAGAIAYAGLMMAALRSWWVDAVGTTALTLHISSTSLLTGATCGIIAAVICIWWTLRTLGHISERSLLAGNVTLEDNSAQLSDSRFPSHPVAPGFGPALARLEPRDTLISHQRRLCVAAIALALIGVTLLLAAAAGRAAPAGAFFGAGSLLLCAALCSSLLMLRRRPRHAIDGRGWLPVLGLGLRGATYRPGRSVLSIAVIASATFILIAVDAFQRDGQPTDGGRRSGVGGYSLIVDTLLPVVSDPNTIEGRNALSLSALDAAVTIEPFRLRPGDDASCLNLYEPTSPRILAARDGFLDAGRFVFSDSLAASDAERANPWLLLRRREADGAIPVIADANSMTYVLHRALGQDIVLPRGTEHVRVRLVGALRDSIFQGELLMSEANFLRTFPEHEGYKLLLIDAPPARTDEVRAAIEGALVDLGADVTGTAERLAQFHKVENTYLSTFQTLGGLGLLLGTVGLAAVLLRNVLERRRELALLGAVGYRRSHFTWMIVAENMLLVGSGLAVGASCAWVAIAPAAAARGSTPFTASAVLLLFAVMVTGLLASVVAIRAAIHAPLLESLRSE